MCCRPTVGSEITSIYWIQSLESNSTPVPIQWMLNLRCADEGGGGSKTLSAFYLLPAVSFVTPAWHFQLHTHARITPACILSEWNSRVDVTEWQDPPAGRNLVPTPQEPGQAVSDQEVWRGGVSSSSDGEKPSTPPPHTLTTPHPTLCHCVCWLLDSLAIVILTLRHPGGDSSSTSHLLQLDWPVWLTYVSQKCFVKQLLKWLIDQFHTQILEQFCPVFFFFNLYFV